MKNQLNLKPIDLTVDGQIIVDSINSNAFDWQIMKTIESLVATIDVLLHYRKDESVNGQVCEQIANTFIQVSILTHMFGKELVQKFIIKRLISMANKHERIKGKNTISTVGFKNV